MNVTLQRIGASAISALLLVVVIPCAFVKATAAPIPATFARAAVYGIGSKTGTAFDLASGDFSGTGIKDLVVADGAGGAVSLLAGRGNGTFAPPTIVYSSPGASITAIAAADFNGDRHLDIAIVREGGSMQDVVLLLGDGHRHFRAAATAPLRFLEQTAPLIHGGIRSLAIIALGHAGKAGAVVTDGVNDISVFPGDGHGSLGTREDYLAAALPTSLLVANLYGRGASDIGLVDNDSASVYTLAGRGDGTFAPRARTPLGALPLNAQPVSLSAGDFRGLGRTDLFVVYSATSNAGNTVGEVLLSDGKGAYARPATVRIADGYYGFPSAGAIGDFNLDGVPDAAVVVQTLRQNNVIELPGNGDGTFSNAAQTVETIKFSPSGVSIAVRMIVDDFNGDGKPDIAVAFDRTPGMGVGVLRNTTVNDR